MQKKKEQNCASPVRGHLLILGPARSTVPSNRIRYYFENILRYDLLLKLNYSNIMQVPQITKIIILAHSVPLPLRPSVSLALEIISGQKVFSAILSDALGQHNRDPKLFLPARSPRRSDPTSQSRNFKVRKDRHSTFSQSNSALLCCSLRGGTMYNFLEKLISLLRCALRPHYDEFIKGQEVQLTLSNREVPLFPEIQNHFEPTALKAIQIKLVTSARNERETRLLWTGLQQKEI